MVLLNMPDNISLLEEAAASEAVCAQARELATSVAYFKLKGDEDNIRTGEVDRIEEAGRTDLLLRMARPGLPQIQPEDVSDDGDWKEF